MAKLWLNGITTNRLEDINELTENYEFFEGLNFVDGGSTDGTRELLEERKGGGNIYLRPWTNDHDLSMNEFLRQGNMKNGDWFLCLDSPDRIQDIWYDSIHKDIEGFEKDGIGALSMAGKIYLARYFDHLFYWGSPHWGLQGVVGKTLGISEKDKSKLITSKRFDAPEVSALLHPAKYYYCYGRSNHCQLLYGKFGQEVVQQHDIARFRFRFYCEKTLGLKFTLDSLIKYMGEYKRWTKEFVEFVELEVNMKDVFRLKVLKQDFLKEIDKNRINWSIKKFLEDGDEKQDGSEYVGQINLYRRQAGLGDEQPCFQ